jgi:hypothetical protein
MRRVIRIDAVAIESANRGGEVADEIYRLRNTCRVTAPPYPDGRTQVPGCGGLKLPGRISMRLRKKVDHDGEALHY